MAFGDTIAGYSNYGRNRARSLYYDGEIYELYLRPEFQEQAARNIESFFGKMPDWLELRGGDVRDVADAGEVFDRVILDLPEPWGVLEPLRAALPAGGIVCGYLPTTNQVQQLVLALEQASYDLGADAWQTFRYVTFPQMRTALLAGGLLAFALSWDEVVVTIFTAGAQQTLPIWIFASLFRPAEQPIVNVVALFVILVSIIPIYFAQRLAGGTGLTSDRPVRGTVVASIDAEP